MRIKGPLQPHIGEIVEYQLEGAPPPDSVGIDNIKPVFELYQKRRNGKYINTNFNTEGVGKFKFSQTATEQYYKIVAFDKQSSNRLAEIEVKPQRGNTQAIHKVSFRHLNLNPAEEFSIFDKIEAVAYTTNLEKRTLLFELFLTTNNSEPLAVEEGIVNRSGIAFAEFNLAKLLLTNSIKTGSNNGEHSFYVNVKRKENNFNHDKQSGSKENSEVVNH